MKFRSKQDVEAPIGDVFRLLSDVDGFERSALRQGISVERIGPVTSGAAPGAGWRVTVPFRGKPRLITTRLITLEAPHAIALAGDSSNFALSGRADLVQLSRSHTRVTVEVEVRPQSFSGRVLLQTLKLGRARLEARFEARVAAFVAALQKRLREERRG